ncbi:Fic/DOC family [Carpediemonas membranifera]|uniref:Fic/DOC family n=1 Tax=Carpediemonas membranifera TaxID=201153 RepID=A0A8J6BBS7_9EUKA|nr:Fic/DOC family [Carpediemonas membranifera]|eukprot:KAG9394092.1 Fic/DOC family [Carpediemonas membranifera]
MRHIGAPSPTVKDEEKEDLMRSFIDMLTSVRSVVGDSGRPEAVAFASVAGFQFAHVHPYPDGNGRASRIFFLLLMSVCGLPASIAQAPYSLAIFRSLSLRRLFYGTQDIVSNWLLAALDQEPMLVGERTPEQLMELADAGRESGGKLYCPKPGDAADFFAYYDGTPFAHAGLKAALALHYFMVAAHELQLLAEACPDDDAELKKAIEAVGHAVLKGGGSQDSLDAKIAQRDFNPDCFGAPEVAWERGERVDLREFVEALRNTTTRESYGLKDELTDVVLDRMAGMIGETAKGEW